jgi:excisionase family DNA binding protein
VPVDLHTAEEIAAFLKVDPHTVLNWAKTGIIPEAFRVGRNVRFSLDEVKASLDINNAGEGRFVELVVMSLSLVFGPNFPRIPKVDLKSITLAEVEELNRLCAAYSADLDTLGSPQECFAYAEGVLEAAREVKREG